MFATKTHEKFLENFNRVREDANEYEFITEYLAATAPITVKHKVCGKELVSTPTRLTAKNYPEKCHYCYTSNKRKTFEEIKEEITALGDGNFELLTDDFKKNIHLLTIKHTVCGTEFKGYRHNIKQTGLRCPTCTPKKGRPRRSQEEVKNMIFKESNGRYELLSDYTDYSAKVEVKDNETQRIETISFITLKNRIKSLKKAMKKE